MFGKHSTLTHLVKGIAIAAVLASVAVPSALASGDRTRTENCQGDAVWITITDDLGLSQLVPVAHGPCTVELACTPSADAGWVSVNDDLGVPFLVPTNPTEAAAFGLCVLAQSSQPAPAAKITKVKTTTSKVTKSKVTKSKYRGWVLITDNTGTSKLVSRSDVRG